MSQAFRDAASEGISHHAADFVVVGSGAGGGAAARVLAEAGYSVVVLEDGPYVPSSKVGAIAFETSKTLMRQKGQMAAFGGGVIPLLQGRCVGGTTFVNSAIIWRLPEKVLHRWHKEFGLAEGFPEREIDAAYEVLERDMNVRPVHADVASRSDHLLELASARSGMASRALHRNESGCKGSGRCLHGCPNDAKQSTTVNYLRRAIEANAVVFAQAKVERVIQQRGRAVGVAGRVSGEGLHQGRPFQVHARRAVIVAGSVFGSPHLLRASGIATQSRALGEHFQAHPGTALGALYPKPVNMWSGAAQGHENVVLRDTLGIKFESINVPPEIAASRLPGMGAKYGQYLDQLPNLAVWALVLRAEAQGSVRPSRFLGDHVRYALTKSDLERLRSGIRRLLEMHFLAGATEVFPGIHGIPSVLTSPDQLDVIETAKLDQRNFTVAATHLFGTCRAGVDPKTSVVDPRLKVHDIKGLYVMDASIFPTNTGVNPQHSIMAIATVAARRLASEIQ